MIPGLKCYRDSVSRRAGVTGLVHMGSQRVNMPLGSSDTGYLEGNIEGLGLNLTRGALMWQVRI